MVPIRTSNLKHWIAPVGGLIAGCIAALVALLIPALTLEDLVWNSGIAAILTAAQPPLGTTARALLALGGGVLVAALTWSALFLLVGPGGLFESALTARLAKRVRRSGPFMAEIAESMAVDNAGSDDANNNDANDDDAGVEDRATADDRIPTLRRADAHPDAPARRPLTAKDLGVPMPPVEVERQVQPVVRDLPDDLDQPLAAFDPAALPIAPREPVRPVAALHSTRHPAERGAVARTAPTLAAGERMTSVELPRGPIDDGGPSIESLLRRLERGTRPIPRTAVR